MIRKVRKLQQSCGEIINYIEEEIKQHKELFEVR